MAGPLPLLASKVTDLHAAAPIQLTGMKRTHDIKPTPSKPLGKAALRLLLCTGPRLIAASLTLPREQDEVQRDQLDG